MQSGHAAEGIEALFRPRSVAIIGATERRLAVGERLVRYLMKHGYTGKIFPLNPKYSSIKGIPCFPSLSEVPEPVDLALVALSAEQVLPAVEECVDKRVKAATIFASGFAEIGPAGRELQEKVREAARRGGLRICGPNCVGTVNVKEGIVATFSNMAEMDKLIPGNVGIVAQSGGMAGSLFDRAQEKELGISYIASTGNELDLEASDYISYMLDDPDTKVIMAFIEGFRNGARFKEVAEKALRSGKSLVILKIGRSKKGEKAAASHTGSLTGSDAVYDALFRQLGVIRVEDIDELVDTASFLSRNELPRGNRIGVFSPSGGAGILIADKCEQFELDLAEPSAETAEGLAKLMPAFGSISNPLDPTGQGYGDPDQLTNCVKVFSRDENFDSVVVQVPTVAGEGAAHLARGVVEAGRNCKGAFAALCTGGGLSRPAVDVLRSSGIPIFVSFETCFKAVGLAAKHAGTRAKRDGEGTPGRRGAPAVQPPAAERVRGLLESRAGALIEYESKVLLSAYAIPCTREGLANSPEEAVKIAREIGYPVAMKVQSPDIPHKTEARVIELNVDSEAKVSGCFQELLDRARKWDAKARVAGILVQEMAGGGVETIAGISHDPTFGPVVLFGLGGIFAETLKDVSLRVAPLTAKDAEEMIREIRGFPLLQGARGRGQCDLDALADVLLKLSQLALDNRERISQLDVNPLVVFKAGQGVKAVDGLVILKESSSPSG